MEAKSKKSLKKLVFAVIIILSFVGCAKETKATYVDANAVEEGIEYYIRMDKDAYHLGETIEMLHRLTNVGDQTLNVCDLDIYTLSLELTRPEGDILFAPAWITHPMPPGIPTVITLNPGEYAECRWYIMLCEWGIDEQVVEEPFAAVGHYYILSRYNNSWPESEGPERLVPDALHFAIIPEPCSIAILGVGLASLLIRKKRI